MHTSGLNSGFLLHLSKDTTQISICINQVLCSFMHTSGLNSGFLLHLSKDTTQISICINQVLCSFMHTCFYLTLLALHTKRYTCANSVDSDETVRAVLSGTALFGFPIWFMAGTPICDKGRVQIQRRTSPL